VPEVPGKIRARILLPTKFFSCSVVRVIRARDLRAGDAFWYLGQRRVAREVCVAARRVLVHTDRGTIRFLSTSVVRPAKPEAPGDVAADLPPWCHLLSQEALRRLEQLEQGPVAAGPLDAALEAAHLARTYETHQGPRSELATLGWAVAAALRASASQAVA